MCMQAIRLIKTFDIVMYGFNDMLKFSLLVIVLHPKNSENCSGNVIPEKRVLLNSNNKNKQI